MIESLAGFGLSLTENDKRYRYKNLDLIHDLYRKKKSIILVPGHYGNWEWMINLTPKMEHVFLGVYKPLHNKYFDAFIKKTREKTGAIAVPMDHTLRTILDYQKREILTLTMLLADQRPIWENIQYWTTFMNQDTPVLLGPEKIAKKTGQVIVFFKVERIRRGYYESEFIMLCDDPQNTRPYEITDSYFKILEKIIREKPELWLWTHNRWKHDKEKFDFGRIHQPR